MPSELYTVLCWHVSLLSDCLPNFFLACLWPRRKTFISIGCNRSFTECGQMIFPIELEDMNLSNHDTVAEFMEAWCAFVSWLDVYIVVCQVFFTGFCFFGIDFIYLHSMFCFCLVLLHSLLLAQVTENDIEASANAMKFQNFVKVNWMIKTHWSKTSPVPSSRQELQLVWKTQQCIFSGCQFVCFNVHDFKVCWNKFTHRF